MIAQAQLVKGSSVVQITTDIRNFDDVRYHSNITVMYKILKP